MFIHRVRLFRLLGFDVFVDASWLMLAALICWTLATGVFPVEVPDLRTSVYWWMGVCATVGLFASIVFHELMHSVIARRFQMPIRGITLFIFGGVAEMTSEPTSPMGEFLMAAAGPAASLALSFIFAALASTAGGSAEAAPVVGVLAYLGTLNRVLGLFNLVPAFPLDGGRMLRAALWAWRKDLTWATRIAAGAGNGFGTMLIAFGLFRLLEGAIVEGLWLFLIGMFVRGASSGAYRQTLAQQIFAGHRIRQFMTPRPIVVAPELPLDELVENFVYRYHHKAFPVVSLGEPIGIVEVARVAQLDRTLWHERRVADVMAALNPDMVISPDAEVLAAIAQMQRTRTSRLLVVSQGQLVGILALRDLLELLALKLELEGHYLGRTSEGSPRPHGNSVHL